MSSEAADVPCSDPASGLGRSAAFAVTLFVADPSRSREFYERVLGCEPVYVDEVSAAFKLANLIINVLAESDAAELVAPAKLGLGGNGPRSLITLEVRDVDAEVARLRELHIKVINGPIDRPWGPRTASFADPDGYFWELAQND